MHWNHSYKALIVLELYMPMKVLELYIALIVLEFVYCLYSARNIKGIILFYMFLWVIYTYTSLLLLIHF